MWLSVLMIFYKYFRVIIICICYILCMVVYWFILIIEMKFVVGFSMYGSNGYYFYVILKLVLFI